MATLITIPVAPSIAHQIQTVTLDGRRFQLRLDWIQRIRRWAMTLSTDSGTPIVSCKLLAVRADLLRQHRYREDTPQGVLAVVDTETGADAESGFATLGGRHRLIYLSDE